MTQIRTLDELRSAQLGTPKVTAILLGLFAMVALFITIVGCERNAGALGRAQVERDRDSYRARRDQGKDPGQRAGYEEWLRCLRV